VRNYKNNPVAPIWVLEHLSEDFFSPKDINMNLQTFLKLQNNELEEILRHIPQNYYHFQIPKGSGGFRSIKAPSAILKQLQIFLLHNLLYEFKVHNIAHGFVTKLNAKTNAQVHRGAGVILELDIENFFISIKKDDVRRLLMNLFKAHPEKFGFVLVPPSDFHQLTELFTLDGSLPQGAPTSPAIANLYCYSMDGELKELAKKYNCIVTRYADDITISNSNSHFDIGKLIKDVAHIVGKYHLRLNKDKTRILRPNRRMEITGVVINNGLNASKKYRKLIRAKVHNHVNKTRVLNMEKLRGEIEWIRYLNPQHGQPLIKKLGLLK
jgi:retron-type reverse transcriptase